MGHNNLDTQCIKGKGDYHKCAQFASLFHLNSLWSEPLITRPLIKQVQNVHRNKAIKTVDHRVSII